jgi:hypothetical protein
MIEDDLRKLADAKAMETLTKMSNYCVLASTEAWPNEPRFFRITKEMNQAHPRQFIKRLEIARRTSRAAIISAPA